MSYIKNLQQSRANYNNIDQARTQANSLNLLSSGIYTEEERFIYELLQNAIDAFQDTSGARLKVNLSVDGDYLIFSHNGKAFDQKDIEGICSVGNGTKKQDNKKIGYKGIGFKSVFMTSSEVHIYSGDYIFKFDKEDSVNYMPEHLHPISSDDVPWQIIPIETETPPVNIPWDISWDAPGENTQVAICIKLKNTASIISRIKDLLSKVDFLLFLNAPHIEVTFTDLDGTQVIAQKISQYGLVELSLNGSLESCWLLHSTAVPVGEDVREYIKQNPTSIPDKLKEQSEAEVSFAIRLEDEEILRMKILGIKDSVVYTYLPTSYTQLGLPFLVNANFITDASRQQLQSDSVWNQNLLRHIPKLYLEWMAQISQTYRESYFEALPTLKSHATGLVGVFYTAFEKALQQVAFLPSLDDESRVLRVSEAFIDRLDLSDIIGSETLVGHLNRAHNLNLHQSGRVAISAHLANGYGVFTFNWNRLDSLFQDEVFCTQIGPRLNYELLSLFVKRYDESTEQAKAQIESYIKDLGCLMTANECLVKIADCSLPPNEDVLDIPIEDIDIIHPELYALLENTPTLDWLKDKFGLSEFSKLRFVEIILDHTYEITEENAIDVGRLLFRINQEVGFLNKSEYKEQLQKLSFLTKQGTLKPIVSLYLGTQYKPKHDIETMAPQEDIYISEEYLEDCNDELSVQEWALFFKKCGASDSVGINYRVLQAEPSNTDLEPYPVLQKAAMKFLDAEHPYKSHKGYNNQIHNKKIRIAYFTLISPSQPQKEIDQFVFGIVLSQEYPKGMREIIYGSGNWFANHVEHELHLYLTGEYENYQSFIEYTVKEIQCFPTTLGISLQAKDIYLNTDNIRNLASNYLPVLDIDSPVHESWLKVLPFKKELCLDDLLELLSCISQEKDKEQAKANKERVETIYRKILEQDLHIAGRDKLEAWAKSHNILSTKDGQYFPPSELSYITVQGFNPDQSVFLGKLGKDEPEKIVSFLSILGVKVVTEITPNIAGESPNETLKELLVCKLPYLALLKVSTGFKGNFDKATLVLEDLINSLACYHCQGLSLSYGDKDDVVSKIAYFDSERKSFYYTGKLSSTRLEVLVSGLVDELKLRSYAQEVLTILTTESHEELVEYLQDKGCNTSLLPEYIEKEKPSVIVTPSPIDTGLSDDERRNYQIEAQKILMSTYPSWQFPDGYGTKDGNYPSVVRDIKDKQGNAMVIVLKSYRDQSQPLKMTAEECEALLNEKARLYLCVKDGDKLVTQERSFISLIGGQESITISFDATNLIDEKGVGKIQKFVKLLHYFNGLHINITQYNPAINLYTRHQGEQVGTTDNDL